LLLDVSTFVTIVLASYVAESIWLVEESNEVSKRIVHPQFGEQCCPHALISFEGWVVEWTMLSLVVFAFFLVCNDFMALPRRVDGGAAFKRNLIAEE